jgi:signal transduction histidine kinase
MLWLAAGIGHRAAERHRQPARAASLIRDDLRQLERQFGDIDRRRADVLAWMQHKAGENTAGWVFNQDFHLYAYRADSLIAWSTSSVLPPAQLSQRGRLYTLSNGTYYGYGYRAAWLPAGVSLTVLYPVAISYPLTNEYLQPGFHASDAIDPGTVITDTPAANSAVLYAPDGRAIGYVHTLSGAALPNAPPAWIIYCWALAVVALCCWVHITAARVARNGHAAWAIALLAVTIILVRTLMYVGGMPFGLDETDLFSPQLYAASMLLPSLGDLLLNTLAALWLLAFIGVTAPLRAWYDGAALPKALRWAAAIAVHILLAAGTVLFVRLIRSLVLDSLIPFDNVHLSSLDGSSMTGLLITSLLTSILLVGAAIARTILESLLLKVWQQSLATIAGFALILFLHIRESLLPVYALACGWLALVIIGQHIGRLREARGVFRTTNLLWSVAHCLLLTFLLQSFTRSRELNMRRNFAERVATRQDDALEYNFGQIEPYVRNDSALRHFLKYPDENARKALDDRLTALYFNNNFAAYQPQIYLFDVNNRPLFNSDTASITGLVAVTQEEVPSPATPSLYYREAAPGDHVYLGIIDIKDTADVLLGVLIIDLEQKKIVSETVLPELLQPATINQAQKAAGYSYALYIDQKLVAQTSDYPFPFYIPRDTAGREYYERKGDDFSTLIYTPDPHRTVSVWHRFGTLSEGLTIFSYLLLIRFLLIGFIGLYRALAGWLAHPKTSRLPAAMSLRRRVQFSVMGIVAFSFLMIGIITVVVLSRQYANTNKTKRQAMMRTVSRAIQQYMRDEGAAGNEATWRAAMADTRFKYFLGNLAAAQKIDINLFDGEGRLAVATQQAIYDQGLLAPVMRPEALAAMYGAQPKPLQMDEEAIGGLRYISCYAPLRDTGARIAGFLNVPLFYSQRELEEQISSVVVALINLYAVIFLLSSVLTVFIMRWITRAFDVIIKQFGRLALHGNEPLQWPYDDEIGLLVVEYNKMVRKVEESAALLARSEREGAFREMARQVAHEINNPLSPMKMRVQHLQKALQEGQPNVLDIAERTSESLLEQINNLSVIATEFSDFARIGMKKPEEIDLTDVVRNVVELYVNEPSAGVTFSAPEAPIHIMADRSQLVRIITNLMQNAKQAIPAGRRGRIAVRLSRSAEEAVIAVQDNGQGISDEAARKLFTPYFTTKTSGTGIGLAMTRQMVEAWGGSIGYETVQGEGTTFFIRLPAKNTEQQVPS